MGAVWARRGSQDPSLAQRRSQRAPVPRRGSNWTERGDAELPKNPVPHQSVLPSVCAGDTPVLPPRKPDEISLRNFPLLNTLNQHPVLLLVQWSLPHIPGKTAHNPVSGVWLWKGKNPKTPPSPPPANKLITSSSSATVPITRQQSSSRGGRGPALSGPAGPRRPRGREEAARPRPAWARRRAPGTRHIAPGWAAESGRIRSAPLAGRAAPPGAEASRRRRRQGREPGRCQRKRPLPEGLLPAERRRLPSGAAGRSPGPPSALPRSPQRLQGLTSSPFCRAEERTA